MIWHKLSFLFFIIMSEDLNKLIENFDYKDGGAKEWNKIPKTVSILSPQIDINVYFENIVAELLNKISKATAIIGCVAWLTNQEIIDGLSTVEHGVSIIVQKEYFLMYSAYKRKYNNIPPLKTTIYKYDHALRWCGHYNKNKFACPRMHDKFLVFGDVEDNTFKPYAVWTGSFNLTDNSTNSFENSVYLDNIDIAEKYTQEWERILSISEKICENKIKLKYNLNNCLNNRKNIKMVFNKFNKTNQKYSYTRIRDECYHNGTANIIIKSYFTNLDSSIVNNIRNADVVVGCVAWLTNINILEALSTVKYGVSMIVQKEDFLRPDSIEVNLKKYYNKIKPYHWYGFTNIWYRQNDLLYGLNTISQCCYESEDIYNPDIQGKDIFDHMNIRCVGHHNSENKLAFPRMHHKFLVLCKTRKLKISDISNGFRGWEKCNAKNIDDLKKIRVVEPYAVWTGSFNFTNNGMNSLENAIVIHNDKIANTYYQQWMKLMAISEPLDWNTPWAEPIYRVGT